MFIRLELGLPGEGLLHGNGHLYNGVLFNYSVAIGLLSLAWRCLSSILGVKACWTRELGNGIAGSSDRRLKRGLGLRSLGCQSSYVVNTDRLTNLIPLKGEQMTLSSITHNGDCLAALGDALCVESIEHTSPVLYNRKKEWQGPKFTNNIALCRNSGWPYPRKWEGYGVNIVAVRNYATAKGDSRKFNDLIKLIKEDSNRHFDYFIQYVANIDTLIYAYESIKSKPGNMTPGVGSETLDEMSNQWFQRISDQLLAGEYNFQDIRRIYIPKKIGSKDMRPLGIRSPRDKVVQKALETTLQLVFDPTFLNTSHGFRPNKGCHSALNQVRMQFAHVHWIIESDIRKCFDRIDHQILLGIISRRISCPITLTLIESAFKAGYIEEIGNNVVANQLGTPQGSVLSPLLCNIYLNEMDLKIQSMIEKFNQGKERRINPVYQKLSRMHNKLEPGSEAWKLVRYNMRSVLSKDPMDPNFKRMYYVRYADDFIIGIQGNRKDAVVIRNELSNWLTSTLKLELHPDKTFIRHFTTESVIFLGVKVGPNLHRDRPVVLYCHGRRQRITPRLPLTLDVPKLYRKLKERGFVNFSPVKNMYVGIRYTRLQNLDIPDIIRYFNTVFRGLWNYYSFVDNRSALNHVWWSFQESLAFTISSKLRLTGIHRVFKQFGFPTGTKTKDGVSLWRPTTFARDPTVLQKLSKGSSPTFAQFLKEIETSWVGKLTRTNLGKACIICDTTQDVEMHHVRQIKDLRNPNKKLDFFTAQMAAINRKQVPLCKEHHIALHKGTLCERDRELFKLGCNPFIKKQKNSK